MRKFFIIFFFTCLANSIFAQDPHFSQFFASPLTLNPAFTGKFDGTMRLAGNYRNQWPTINRAYVTTTASVDFPILKKLVQNNDTWGLGFMGYSDKSANGAVAFNYFSASTAFHKGLDEDGYTQLGFGMQGTYSNMNIYPNKLTFEDQLTPLGFTGPTSEVFNGTTLSKSFLDINAGLLLSTSSTDRNNLYAGISLYHINRPKQKFLGNTDSAVYLLQPRATFHAGGFFPVSANSALHISALYSSQAKAHETVIGGAFQIATDDLATAENPTSLYVGAWMRLGDALIPFASLEFNNFRVGISYDVNTSSLRTASQSRGGFELSLIYIAKPPGSKGIPCPKF